MAGCVSVGIRPEHVGEPGLGYLFASAKHEQLEELQRFAWHLAPELD